LNTSFKQVKDLFLIGKTLKSHGTAGQLRLMIEDKFKAYIVKGTYLFLDLDGSRVPFRIKGVHDAQHFVIALKDVDTKEESDVLSGKDLWIETELVKARHRLSPRNIKGKWDDYTILDATSGKSFDILRTEEYPQQLMAVVHHNEKEILIPLHEDLITDIDKSVKIIHMTIPEGLLEL
jgi:16S rRNA processing protein RimM